jgi:porphobilinogen deaminase
MTLVRVGTRSSALALWQANYVVSRLRELAPDARIQIVEIASAGDEVTDAPLRNRESCRTKVAPAARTGIFWQDLIVAILKHSAIFH